MPLKSSLLGQLPVARLLVWLFNVALALIFLGWVVVDGVICLVRKLIAMSLRQKIKTDMKKNEKPEFKPVLIAGVMTVLLMTFTIPAIAGEDVSYLQARKLQAAGEILSFEKIAEIARSIKPGDILETELERNRKNGLYIYEIEILDAKGVVWELDINAKTGELIKIEVDD